jgi:hypothetical protein
MKIRSLNIRGTSNSNQLFKDVDGYDEDGDEESNLRLLVSIAASSSSSGKSPSISSQSPIKTLPTHVTTPSRMLETRILIAMYNLRSAMEEIETARLPRSTKDEQKQNLIVAVCSLESAMQTIGSDAVVASRDRQADNEIDNEQHALQDYYDEEEDNDDESGYNRFFCCLNSYEVELDENTIATEDTVSVAGNKEADRILVELKREEAMLRQFMTMAMALREHRGQKDGITLSSFLPVLISGSDNEGRDQLLSAVAPSCRLCGGNHWKFRCPSMQDSFLFQDNSPRITSSPNRYQV